MPDEAAMPDEGEERYVITPKGRLTLDLARALDQLLVEQRQAFKETLTEAIYLMAQGRNHFCVASKLADGLCILGFGYGCEREGGE